MNYKKVSKYKVSVIIPCYNDGKYIEETILSVMKQSYNNIEVVVVNDGSTDDLTMKKLLEIEKKYPLKLIHMMNSGPAAARNMGIKKSSGEFILPLDADDLISKTYIEKAVKILIKKPNIGIVYCKARFFGLHKGPWNLPPFSIENFVWDNMIFNSALYRKSSWKKYGGYDESFDHGDEDYDLWISFIKNGLGVYRIPEVLFKYRIKSKSRTSEFLSSTGEHYVETNLKKFKKHRDFYLKHLDAIIRKRLELEIKAASII